MNVDRFNHTIAAFDAVNATDPNQVVVNGVERPKSLVYAERMTAMLQRYVPDASETLQFAARAQHIERWAIPRDTYPMSKPGYLQWRNALKQHHADVVETLMQKNDYDEASIAQVCSLLKKENLRSNPDMQTLEDVIVLAFLEHDLAAFVEKYQEYSEEKFISILRKSYRKMSEKGQQAALNLIEIPEHLLAVVQKAVA